MFLRDVPIESVVLLKKIIVSHGGSISENIDTATHVVDWYEDVDSLPEEITEEFVRPLELQKDGRVRVHWLYHPDSYDEIIPREEVDVEDSVGQLCGAISVPKKEKWHVACRFITDCEMFNEWGNELDYEIEEKLEVEEKQEMETGKGRGGRRKSRKRSSTTPSGALLVEEKVQFTDSLMADTMPTTLRAAVATVTDLSGEVAKTSRENRSSSNPSDSVTSKKRKVNDRERFADLSSVSSINWFIEDKVSEYERQHLYFLRARDETTETEYLHIRRQLIELSNQISPAYLSSTDARRKIAGDVNKIFEAHSFLDGTGHINKSVNPYSRPSKYVTGAESVPHNAAKDSIKVPQVQKELESKLDDYIATRLDCLNKKVHIPLFNLHTFTHS